VRVLGPADGATFRAQRLRALREHPDAFGRAPEEVDSSEVWTERLRAYASSELDFLLGAFDADSLVGAVGCHRDHGIKQRHIAYVWGCTSSPSSAAEGSADDFSSPRSSVCVRGPTSSRSGST